MRWARAAKAVCRRASSGPDETEKFKTFKVAREYLAYLEQ